MKRNAIDLFTQSVPKFTKKHKTREKSVQVAISEYVSMQYKHVIFFADASGVRLTMGQAITLKRMRAVGISIPDMILLEPRGEYCGLLLEIKTEENNPFLQGGGLSKKPHIQEQNESMERLKEKGYACFFAVGIDHAKQIIDNYMAYDVRTSR